MKIRSSIVTSADVLRLIEEARDAELCRNLELFRDILSYFWDDIEQEPNFEDFAPIVRAESLRLCGVFLSQFGRARGLSNYQVRAKDLLGYATRLFESENFPDKAAEAKVALANCYWFSGEISEYDDILRSIEAEFGTEPAHPVSIQIKLNNIFVAIWRRDAREAMGLVNEIVQVISVKHDLRLRTQFHNLAGMVSRMAGNLDLSALHAKEAVRIARMAKNDMFVAFNLNNLAFVYRIAGRFDQARKTIDEALSIMESRGDRGWIPHALDTKALIYFDQAEYYKALGVIERSIEIFSKGEDYNGLTDALWTKCLCLLRLHRFNAALEIFIELGDISARQIGQIAVDKFTTLLMEQIYILKQFPLADELTTLKRSLVLKAMQESGGHVSNAARKLGLRSQQHLSQILNKEFPDIYDELGIKRRVRRTNPAKQKEPPIGLSRLIMPKSRTYLFNFTWRGTLEPQFYYFPPDLMRPFGIKKKAIVAVMPVKSESLFDGGIVLYFKDPEYRIGRLAYDELAQIFLVDLDEPTFLSEVQLIGVPIGYCSVSEKDKRTMKFEKLKFVK